MRVVFGRRCWLLCGMLVLSVTLAGCASFSSPVSEPKVAGFVAELQDSLSTPVEPLIGVLTAEDSVYRAIKYNQAVRAKELEAALGVAKVHVQAGAMLPTLVAESNYYRRDRALASHSTGSPVYSSSSDLQSVSRDISLAWNILDFGLSFVRSRQALDKAFQAHEETRRVRARIAEETLTIYWRAVALEALSPALIQLDREIEDALDLARRAARDPAVDPMVAITLQRDTLNMQRDLNQLQVSLAGATDQLKQLIGQPALAKLRLAQNRKSVQMDAVKEDAASDITAALQQRPEIRQHMYDLRISEEEVIASVLQALPGATFSKSLSSDSNPFLLHSLWISWGARIAGDLMKLSRLPSDIESYGRKLVTAGIGMAAYRGGA